MNLLIVAATEAEIAPAKQALAAGQHPHKVEILITGLGMLAIAYALTRHLQTHTYDLVIQAGIGGSFDYTILPGTVLFITSEQYGDLGAEDHGNYIDIFDMGFLDKNALPYTDGKLHTPLGPLHGKIGLRQASAITVNTVSGNAKTIAARAARYNAIVESMEGAAFHYICLQENIPFAQVRAISNHVTPRDRSQWKMKEAVASLNDWLIGFISRL